jgi:hypothetical protein
MTDASNEQRWYQRRRFWFATGILADRRTGIDRRELGLDDDRTAPAATADDRRVQPPRRIASERRVAERRSEPR